MISNKAQTDPYEVYRRGDRCLREGNVEKAKAYYEQAVSLKKDFVEAHFKLATLFAGSGDLEKASAAYKTCIRIEPRISAVYNNLGLILKAQGNLEAAISCFRKGIDVDPMFVQVYSNLGTIFYSLRKLDLALEVYLKAVGISPMDPIAQYNLGLVRKDLGHLEDALTCFEKAITIEPRFSQALNNAGITLNKLGRTKEAILKFESAVDADPKNADACYNLGKLLQDVCDWRNLDAVLDLVDRQTRESIDAGIKPAEEPFFNLARSQSLSQNLHVARLHSHDIELRSKLNHPNRKLIHKHNAAKKITIGYLSNSFGNHPTAHLMVELFKQHDRKRITVHCYSYGRDDQSSYYKRIQKGCDQFIDISNLTTAQAAKRIRDSEVDILVDLKGHTSNNRLDICVARPASIQVRYLGMAGTSGASFFDYIVTDPIVTPLEHASHYSEKLVHMPHSYQVNSSKAVSLHTKFRSRRSMGLPERGSVFAAFLAGYKIDPELFTCWANILKQVTGSVLWLWERDHYFKENIIREAQERSLDPKRIIFAKELPKPEHLARLSLADLCLDTRAVNGAATTSDALWAGVPVVTIKGRHFASRMSASILTAVGLEELIADDLQQYEELAVALATDGKRLKALREKLERNKRTHPLFDTRRFVRNLENAYEQMWAIYKSGGDPRHIQVKDCGPSADMHGL
ncbi:tetratricopeptide repeat protein [uncultured Desulfosarcina sp.]|uniref:O-linked N-acetylglucosamine transferase family protein n=1 Tax=uncultured Desulfosarcina sp. TaxID=218289 RepID=UPI0029C6F930|nr:tetratricopeptide repeat protein [uncultured Desulfosarcina sp.]